MKITVIGGGPGGLYFSILTKKALPHCTIDVYERNKPDDSFGFGVVFSDETLGEFLTRDTASYELIRSKFAYWDDIIIARDGEEVRIQGNGFCGCSRKMLLQLLQQRCEEEGVNLHFEAGIEGVQLSQFKDSDIIVASDGIHSMIREQFTQGFGTKVAMQSNRFVWLGSTKPLDAFTYFFRNTPYGMMVAHTYQYQEGMSTWIIECADDTWQKAGFEVTNEQDTMDKVAEIFKEELDGHPLIPNKSFWRKFPAVTNEVWHKDNIVLIGDAKATAHYSIGSGTKLAMESAIALSDAVIANQENVQEAFAQYEKSRRNTVEMIQYAANVSLSWFENMDRYKEQPFMQFAFGVMTRSKKVTFENLAIRDASFPKKVLAEFNDQHGFAENTPAAFTPFSLRGMHLINRVVMSPMGQYTAVDGLVNNWHLVHYGARATGGVGLIITEMTAISAEARITLGCAGIYNEEQIEAWKQITQFIHQNSQSKIAIQLGHAGRKGATTLPWEKPSGIIPKSWELTSASAIAYKEGSPVPQELSASQMEVVISQFAAAAHNAELAEFDMIELQAHHGFLLGSFLSPLTNIRIDEYGGSIENRLKFPLAVFNAIRHAFPAEKPISVRISASDWAENGISENDVIQIAIAFKNAGADIINVSTGNTVANQKPLTGRMWQTPYSDMVRHEADVPTITTGTIQDIDQINTIILNGRADLVALGRPLLLDASLVRNAQAYENYKTADIPKQYMAGTTHLYPFKIAERKANENMKRALKPASHKK